ncbi:MAG: hypothetical protein VX642_04470 [Bdellovibrionota bacterium]|nr:hypothetical protein [Bdellovibrionota bacterium]
MRSFLYLSLLCLININLLAQSQNRAKTQDAGKIAAFFSGKKSIVLDYGYSANLLLSDFSTNVSGLGLGNQYSIQLNFNQTGKRGFKVSYANIVSEENNFRNSEVSSDSSAKYRSFQQKWNLIGFGLETRKSNRLLKWYWDWSLGYAFGKDSEIGIRASDSLGATESSIDEPTRSFLFVGLGAGIRKPIHKKWTVNASLKSFYLLGSVYGGDLKSKSLFLVPLMASFGLEYGF